MDLLKGARRAARDQLAHDRCTNATRSSGNDGDAAGEFVHDATSAQPYREAIGEYSSGIAVPAGLTTMEAILPLQNVMKITASSLLSKYSRHAQFISQASFGISCGASLAPGKGGSVRKPVSFSNAEVSAFFASSMSSAADVTAGIFQPSTPITRSRYACVTPF